MISLHILQSLIVPLYYIAILHKYYATKNIQNTYKNIETMIIEYSIFIIEVDELPQHIEDMIVVLQQKVCIYIKKDLSIDDRQKALYKEFQKYLHHENMISLKQEVSKRIL